jgi:hypothetical protein
MSAAVDVGYIARRDLMVARLMVMIQDGRERIVETSEECAEDSGSGKAVKKRKKV